MFPFNQSYRPRKPSPELPMSPLSVKGSKRTRKRKAHVSPYTRPISHSLSSQSEADYEAVLHEGTVFSSNEQVVYADPMDLSDSEDIPHHETTIFSVSEQSERIECVSPMKLTITKRTSRDSIMFSPTEKDECLSLVEASPKMDTPLRENPPDPTNKNSKHLSLEEVTTTDDAPQAIVSSNETLEYLNPGELITKEEQPKDEPLKYGDLVVVEYAEKRKKYQWPAIIVPPAHMTDNMLDYPPEDDDTAIGVRWVEPLPSYSWVPESAVKGRVTPEMIENYLSTISGPKKLVQAWELARNPPSVFEYMLEKKLPYYKLVEKYKSL